MKPGTFPLFGAAMVGCVASAVSFSLWTPRPASAQLKSLSPVQQPLAQPYNALQPGSSTQALPQPLTVQALDSDHFVVATREPRLVSPIGQEGTAQNMLLTVVTHYTVQGERLVPIEHVRVPAGYRVVTLGE